MTISPALGPTRLTARFSEVSAPARAPARWATFGVAALAGLSGAASVALAAGSGFLGGSYATTFGFFGVAQENLGLAAAAALLLLVTSPAALFCRPRRGVSS